MAQAKLMNCIMIASAILLLLGAIQSPQAEARKSITGVNQFCRTATNRRSCTKMVNGATNMHDASANAIKATIENAKRLRSLVPTIEPAISHLEPVRRRDEIRKTCIKGFNNIVDFLQVSLQALEDGDIDTTTTYLSGAGVNMCKNSLMEDEIGSELPLNNKYWDHFIQSVGDCLAVVLQK